MSDSTKLRIDHMLSPLTSQIIHYFDGPTLRIMMTTDISFDRNMNIYNIKSFIPNMIPFDPTEIRAEDFCLDALNFGVVSGMGLTGVIYRNHQHELKLSKYRGNDGLKLKKALIENLELLSKHTYSSINDMITMVLL